MYSPLVRTRLSASAILVTRDVLYVLCVQSEWFFTLLQRVKIHGDG